MGSRLPYAEAATGGTLSENMFLKISQKFTG